MTALHNLELQGKYLQRKYLLLCVIIRQPSVFQTNQEKFLVMYMGKYDITTAPLQVSLQW
jgi:hypothetical protein